MGKKFTGEDKLLQELYRLVREINEKGMKTRTAYKSHMVEANSGHAFRNEGTQTKTD